MRHSQSHNQNGFSLIDAMIGVCVGVVVLLSSTAVLLSYDKGTTFSNAEQTKNSLIGQIKLVASNYQALVNSAKGPGNGALSACLSGAANGCTSLLGAQDLYLFQGDATGSPQILTGPPGNDQYYDVSGQNCALPHAQCAFKVTTQFLVQCPSTPPGQMVPPSVCTGPPDIVKILYTVQQQAGGLGKDNSQLASESGSVIVQGPQ